MAKIKEIKKIGPNIKEIKKQGRVEITLEDEVAQADTETFVRITRGGRSETATLEGGETPQERVIGPAVSVSKEDEAEMHFRPSYTSAGSPYQEKSYSPMMEGSGRPQDRRGEFGASSTLRREPTAGPDLGGMGSGGQTQNESRNAGRPEAEGSRGYVEGPKRERRHN